MRIRSWGQVAFGLAMAGLGVVGLMRRDFAPVWEPVGPDVPGRVVLVYATALISLGTGLGMLWEKFAGAAARMLAVSLVVWMVVFELKDVVHAPTAVGSYFGCADIAVMLAAALVVAAWPGPALRIARVLFGLALILYGSAHFAYLGLTTVLIPKWIPAHVAMAYFTGAAFLAAAVAVLTGVCARLAATLMVVQLGLFTVLVWVPIVAAGGANAFQRSETILSAALTAGAWVVADSYAGRKWVGRG